MAARYLDLYYLRISSYIFTMTLIDVGLTQVVLVATVLVGSIYKILTHRSNSED